MAFTDKSTDKETCTALKTVSYSNQHLATQADKKAHILIQVSALMISVVLVFILRINNDHRIALLPVMALMITCLVVIILALMADDNLMYMSLTRDIYFQAVILGKKYRFLRMSYHVFMTGLAISVLSFIFIAFR